MGAPILMVLEGISDEFAGQDVAAKYVSLFSSIVVIYLLPEHKSGCTNINRHKHKLPLKVIADVLYV